LHADALDGMADAGLKPTKQSIRDGWQHDQPVDWLRRQGPWEFRVIASGFEADDRGNVARRARSPEPPLDLDQCETIKQI
jgi:hypothetical protein